MLVTPAVAFWEVVLALHTLAVVFAFGATFAYPVLLGAVSRADTRAMPALYRALHAISQRVIMPGVAAILVFGIYLASHLHLWSSFFVQWGLGVVIVIGAVEGAYLGPREKRLIEVADRDVAAAGGESEVRFSPEHDALVRRVGGVGALMDLLVVITIFFMVTRLGA
ncbi:MAG TPA: hypothetical protein VJ996_00465 [Solirubrobacteraceae bacterium]|nr:hypothetical protein [Solirubrobacteraceae bacterium]